MKSLQKKIAQLEKRETRFLDGKRVVPIILILLKHLMSGYKVIKTKNYINANVNVDKYII